MGERHRLSRLSLAARLIFGLLLSMGSSAHATGPGESAGPVDLVPPVPDPVPDPDFITIYSGFEIVEDSNFFYSGFIAAVNGDLSRHGFLIQGFGGIGDYEYFNSGAPDGKVHADLTEASGLLGYQFFAGDIRFRAFGGVDWQDNDLSPPDQANPVSGRETDFVATGNITTVSPKPLYFNLFGSYSIANQTYWSKARVGYNFGRLVIGPEGAFYGNENFNSQRAGAFVRFPLARRLDATLAGGFNFVINDEFFDDFGSNSFGGLGGITDSGYGNISLSTWF